MAAGEPEQEQTGADEPEDGLAAQVTGGILYLVATPIGHRGDLSPRARAVLAAADVVAAEDTRHTGRLLASLGIHRRLDSFHEHNEATATPRLVAHLKSGRSVALASDAGTPGLSDPGFVLVRAAVAEGITVSAVPGPTALIAALTVSGLPTDAFTFTGFLPPRSGRRRRVLEGLAELPHTLVFYESPYRLAAALADLLAVLGDRPAAVCRELTKRFEEVRRGPLSELAACYATSKVRGEFTLVVAGTKAGLHKKPRNP
jgi:16S rRNA (cytidine1402-2'-O)-methyltransferase